MYLPKHFNQTDDEAIRKLISENSFATVISYPAITDAPIFINHLPVIWSAMPGEEKTLIGHMAKRNPQWTHFQTNSQCTIVIQGPHTYVSPSWYKSGRDVPTWNYAVAHIEGRIELVENFSEQVEIIKAMTVFFEADQQKPWQFELPSDLNNERALTASIISFKFHIKSIDAKFKLSQNRGIEDREGVKAGLVERGDEMSIAIAELL